MPCQLSRMWRLKGRWVVGGGGICKLQTSAILLFKTVQIRPQCSLYLLCVCLCADNLLFRMYPNTNNFGPLISSKTAWGFPQGLNCTSRSRLTQREGMLLLLLMPSPPPRSPSNYSRNAPCSHPGTVVPPLYHPCTHPILIFLLLTTGRPLLSDLAQMLLSSKHLSSPTSHM